MPPCRRCGGLSFEAKLDIAKRDAVLEAAWPIGITDYDRKFLRDHHFSPGPDPKKERTP